MYRSAVHVMTDSNIIDLDLDLTNLSTDTIILGHFDVIMLDPCQQPTFHADLSFCAYVYGSRCAMICSKSAHFRFVFKFNVERFIFMKQQIVFF